MLKRILSLLKRERQPTKMAATEGSFYSCTACLTVLVVSSLITIARLCAWSGVTRTGEGGTFTDTPLSRGSICKEEWTTWSARSLKSKGAHSEAASRKPAV
jgi:hypothetical protein